MIKTWKKNIFITGALLSFFFLLGLSTARADCSTENITITSTNTAVAGVYEKNADLNGYPTYLSIGDPYYIYSYRNYGGPMNPGNKWWLLRSDNNGVAYKSTTLLGDLFTNDEYTATVSQTTCEEPTPELVGGFFFKTPPASSLGAGVGTISTDVMGSLLPYIFLCGGLLIGFWLVEKILALIPKDNTMEKADREIARSKRDIKEEKKIIATLD